MISGVHCYEETTHYEGESHIYMLLTYTSVLIQRRSPELNYRCCPRSGIEVEHRVSSHPDNTASVGFSLP